MTSPVARSSTSRLGLRLSAETIPNHLLLECGDGTLLVYGRPAPNTADHTQVRLWTDDVERDVREFENRGATFEDCVADGSVISGTPQRVSEEIERQVAELGVNYLLTYLFLGTMTLKEALGSLELFSTEVMPKLAKL